VKPEGLKILAVVPSILDNSGSAVNERQFLRELCNSNKCYIITLIPLALLKELSRFIGGFRAKRVNYDVVVPLPVIPIPNMWVYLWWRQPRL